MIAEIEVAIINKLKQALSQVKIVGFPENPRELGAPQIGTRLLVGYKRSSFRVISQLPTRVEQIAEFEVQLEVKGLRTHSGAYPLLDAARSALLGYIPIQGPVAGMYPTQESFQDLDESIWYYQQTWAVPLSGSVSDYEPLPDEPVVYPEVIEIRSGLWRSKVGSLPEDRVANSTLDTIVNIPLE